MALRSLDNALPIKAEKPKKPSLKPSSPAPKPLSPCEPCANDENAVPATAIAVEASVEYVASEDLEALSDPQNKIKSLLAEMDSKDWIKVCESLNDVRRLALHHETLLLPILENVMLVIVKAMKNPRSALCKTAIMTSADIFGTLGGALLSTSEEATGFDNLLLQLLLKASQDKRFVCEEAERALEKIAGSTFPLPLLKKLCSYVHHANPRVRAKAAVAISKCLAKTNTETMKEFGLATLLQIAAELLNDRLPEAREAARSIVSSVHTGFVKQHDMEKEDENGGTTTIAEMWQSFCTSNLSPLSAQSVVKIISQ